MEYKGIIKQSRTLDLTAFATMLDAISLAFLAYSPEQLKITIPVYAVIRMILNVATAYLRFKTTGPVGEK